jgi:4-aminobutyrate aminotransferase
MPTSAELHERRAAAVPRGVSNATAIYAKRAKNAEIWSEDGKRYIDFGAGIAVVNTGHQHPRIVAAVEEQLKAFSHVCFQVTPYESYVSLAERLNAIAPVHGPAKTMLVSTGAEAVENAVKVARAFTGRPGIVSFSGGFHGRTLMGMALTGKVVPYKKGFGPFPSDVYNVAFPNVYHGVSSEQSMDALKALFRAASTSPPSIFFVRSGPFATSTASSSSPTRSRRASPAPARCSDSSIRA